MKTLCVIALLTTYSNLVLGQNYSELVVDLKKQHHDTTHVRVLGQLSEVCEIREIDSISNILISKCNEGLKKHALNKLSVLVFNKEKTRAYNNLGYYANYTNQSIKAIDLFHKALLLISQIEKEDFEIKELKSSIKNNLASTFIRIKEYNNAKQLLFEIIEYDKNNQNYLGTNYNNLGSLYQRTNELDSALLYFIKSYHIRLNINPPNINSLITNCVNLGNVYHLKKQLDSAERYFQKAFLLCENQNQIDSKSTVLYFLGEVQLSKGNYIEAKNKFVQSLAFANSSPNSVSNYSDIYLGLYKVSEKLNDFKSAYYNLLKYELYNDSIESETLREDAIRKDVTFNYEKERLKQQVEFDKKLFIENEISEKRKRIILYSIVSLIVSGIFILLIIWRWRITIKQKKTIELQEKTLQLKQNEILTYSNEIELKNKTINDSIEYAFNIQSNLLPSTQEINNCHESAVLFLPCNIVSGDFYFCSHTSNYSLYILGDCTGHGVSGAFLTVLVVKAIDKILGNFVKIDVSGFISLLNTEIYNSFKQGDNRLFGLDLTVVIHNISTNNLIISGSASKSTVLNTKNEIEFVKFKNLQIGLELDLNRRPDVYEYNLESVKMIYLFTDGIIDQKGEENKKSFGSNNLQELFLNSCHLTPLQQIEIIRNTFLSWKGITEQIDDVSVWIIKFSD